MSTAAIEDASSLQVYRPVGRIYPSPFLVWFSAVALAISVLVSWRIADTDFWVHLRHAKELLATHSLLHVGLCGLASADAPLVSFESLSELPCHFAFRSWDLHEILAVYLALLWLIFGGAHYLALRRDADCAGAALVTMAAALLGTHSFGPRMFHFGWLRLVGLISVLDRSQRTIYGDDAAKIYERVPAAWTNLKTNCN